MELHQFLKESIFLVGKEIVKADTAADKDLFDTGDFSQLSEKRHIVAMVGNHIFAGSGEKALATATSTLRKLLLASRLAEIGGGAAHIVDIALEIRVAGHYFRFL